MWHTVCLICNIQLHGSADMDFLAGLQIGRIQPKTESAALERSVEEGGNLMVDLAAQPTELDSENEDRWLSWRPAPRSADSARAGH
jgi:hypothetical protein